MVKYRNLVQVLSFKNQTKTRPECIKWKLGVPTSAHEEVKIKNPTDFEPLSRYAFKGIGINYGSPHITVAK